MLVTMDDRLAELAEEVNAFEAIRRQLVGDRRSGFAVVQGGRLIDVFDSREAAFAAGLRQFGTRRTFLVRRIEQDEELEAPALALGIIDAKAP